jgi:cyclic beta-1,2-glucan synthetase
MLEWTPAAQAAAGRDLTLTGFYRQMAGALVIAAAAVGVSVISGQGTWPLALLFGLLWSASPAVALRVSLPRKLGGLATVDSGGRSGAASGCAPYLAVLREFRHPGRQHAAARQFPGSPAAVLAHRTSPTNIGLYLLSVVSARDFGWIGTREAIDRLEATLATMEKMEHFKGHLFNWYDTRDLRPLDPRYVSSVDSGNLAGHLIALANACSEWRREPRSDDATPGRHCGCDPPGAWGGGTAARRSPHPDGELGAAGQRAG